MKSSFLVVLVSLSMVVATASTATCQQTDTSSSASGTSGANSHADKIYSQVFKLGIGQDVTVKLLNGRKWHGRIASIDEDSFKLVEVDLGQVILVRYTEAKRVYRGYSEKNVFGNRISPHTRQITSIALLGGLVGLLLFFGSQTR